MDREPDPFWVCPEHGTELAYDYDQSEAAGDWQERWGCPEAGCGFGRWIS